MSRLISIGIALGAPFVLASCGSLYDFGGGSSAIKVSGTIIAVVVADPDRDIEVFVYTDICETKNSDPVLCANLLLPEDIPLLTKNDYRSLQQVRVKAGGNGSFNIKRVKKGNLTVAYLHDNAVNPDRTIDPEDITITRDGNGDIIPNAANAVSMQADDGRLDDARRNVSLDDVSIDFPAAVADSSGGSSSTTAVTVSTSSTSTSVTVP
jgi:hypothetical protein